MNELLIYLFHEFTTNPTEELNELFESREEGLDVEAMRVAFVAGYAAAQKVQAAKYLCAVQNHKRRTRKAATA